MVRHKQGGLLVGLKEAHGGGGAVMALQNWGTLLLTAAARDGLHGWDLRTDTKAFSLAGTPHQVRPKLCQLWSELLKIS